MVTSPQPRAAALACRPRRHAVRLLVNSAGDLLRRLVRLIVDARAGVRLILLLFLLPVAKGADWVRAGVNTNQPSWGIRGGLQFALHPAGFRGRDGGPRGLIRLGYPILTNGGYDLVNYIAVEPVVGGRKGFSELEASALDHKPGKQFLPTAPPAVGEPEPGREAKRGESDPRGRRVETSEQSRSPLHPGVVSEPAPGVEQLEVCVSVERFDNGAHVRLVIVQRSDAPDELRLTVYAEPDSAPLEYCTLTATMGNMARVRELWLNQKVVSSRMLYPNYKDAGFADHTRFPLPNLHANASGDVLVAVTTDEPNPAAVFPFPGTRHWYYGGRKVTQYWRKRPGTFSGDLEAWVNARYTYWQSRQPIPGGIAFENFELRQRFHDGQEFIFGITPRTPAELGFTR